MKSEIRNQEPAMESGTSPEIQSKEGKPAQEVLRSEEGKTTLETQTNQTKTSALPEEVPSLEEQWGIRILGIRLSAAGYMLDFRYRVIDPEKASSLLNRQSKAYLIDQATGTQLLVPRTRLGPMRQTAVRPLANRNYFILFSNPGGIVKAGNSVTVVIGDFKAESLIVE
jgi:hypothetical protein